MNEGLHCTYEGKRYKSGSSTAVQVVVVRRNNGKTPLFVVKEAVFAPMRRTLIFTWFAFACCQSAPCTSERELISFLMKQNRAYREALAADWCPLPANHSTQTVRGYQYGMQQHEGGEKRWLQLTNGGYCLTPQKQSVLVSEGNPLAVGHKMPEHGLYKVLNASLPAGARVLEIGAGQGPLKAFFRARRTDLSWTAIDGAMNVESYTKGLVDYHDVCSPWPPQWNLVDGRAAFDYIVSIEMAEHINPKCEPNFIKLLAQAGKKVLLSWSTAYLRLTHPNARPNAYVVDTMSAVGFKYDPLATNESRTYLHTGMRKSYMVFERTLVG